MDQEKDIKKLLEKVEAMKKEKKLDLSSDEDLSIGVMNLIAIEEHLFFTGEKTGKSEYFDLLNKVREMRKDLLKKIIKEYEGEVWCISKHLLAASMRLIEVGTKALGKGDKKEAEDFFAKAYDLYSLFWGINLKLVKLEDVKRNPQEMGAINLTSDKNPDRPAVKVGIFGKLGELVQKLIDCCKE